MIKKIIEWYKKLRFNLECPDMRCDCCPYLYNTNKCILKDRWCKK